MDFSYPPEAEVFRTELRAWLDANLTDYYREAKSPFDGPADRMERLHEWNRKLAASGYAAVAWPVEYGGRGAGLMEQVVVTEEMHRAKAPAALNPIGIANIAPAIMEWGTEEQKEGFLQAMLRGDHIWCQGFSEPDAGSDLASLKTSAVADGEGFVVNGQKVWNTLGDQADYCELLVRTDSEAPKHRGISCLLVDMALDGIEVRPLTTITGETEFCEIFFTDVRVPRSALLGPENQGWRVAMSTLNSERSGVATLHLQLRSKIQELLTQSHAVRVGDGKASEDPVLRQRLARIYLEGELLKLLSDRALSAMLHGRMGAEGSLTKLVWSHVEQHLVEVAGDVLGTEALTGSWGRSRVYARALSLAGGTTQVNKNIVAQRVLGLPRS